MSRSFVQTNFDYIFHFVDICAFCLVLYFLFFYIKSTVLYDKIIMIHLKVLSPEDLNINKCGGSYNVQCILLETAINEQTAEISHNIYYLQY